MSGADGTCLGFDCFQTYFTLVIVKAYLYFELIKMKRRYMFASFIGFDFDGRFTVLLTELLFLVPI